jgi:RimJ/RimL family protein N-acetyltransferase
LISPVGAAENARMVTSDGCPGAEAGRRQVQGGYRVPPDPRANDSPWPRMVWPPAPDTVLAGSVVTLTRYAEGDAEPLFAALEDDRVWRHLPLRPGGAAELGEWVARRQREGRVTWVVRLTAGAAGAVRRAGLAAGSVVGMSSYGNVSCHDARLEVGGTAYAPSVWGTAVNPEAKLLLLEYAFERARVGRVQLVTDIRNARSQRAIAGIGATYEGVLRRYQRRQDGTVRDSVVFAITIEDWPAVRARLRARLAQYPG